MKSKVFHFNASLGYYSATSEHNKVVFTHIETTIVKIGDMLEGDIENRGDRFLDNENRNIQPKVDIKELQRLDVPFKGHEYFDTTIK